MKLKIQAITIATDPEYGVVAVLEVPATVPRVGRLSEVHRAISDLLGERFRDEVEILNTHSQESGDGICRVIMPVNVFAVRDTLHRLLLLQWIAKRLAECAPPIDLTWMLGLERLSSA